ncbi:phosphoenolpyruvate--protein phosphotransferase [Desulfogranum mediterraneum]|uniref:phosphoenolpyruvate--protein phosphotransferase n=1 Tax=Desulfogranum mediterraneum TaxID=160661 RepID=UPI0004252100|nr:phosphoenolpyruvate--protein phosphotransferase [Desulfogranum mediterraneum]
MQKVLVKAPLSGVIYPLEQVPDPVFSQKLVGDGISIDPVSDQLKAPFPGVISQLHRALHAVTLTHDSGLEVMIHIGIDTVTLKSKGFKALVREGQRVEQGEVLITFESDFVATNAKSLLTQIILTNGEIVEGVVRAAGFAVEEQTDLLTLTLAEGAAAAVEPSGRQLISEAVIIPNTTGLHARPAAVLAGLAKKFQAEIGLLKGEQRANAKSVVSIMKLNVAHLDKVQICAVGPDAAAALEEILPKLESGLGDQGTTPVNSPASLETTEDRYQPPQPKSGDPSLLLGVVAAPGLAVGKAFQIREERFDFAEEAEDSHRENVRLDAAIETAKNQLEALQAALHKQADPAKAAIFAAHREILDDPDLIEMARSLTAKGKSSEYAWQRGYTSSAEELSGLSNEILAGRANDLKDVGKRVLRILTGRESEEHTVPEDAILIAEELTPSFTATIDTDRVRGFCTTTGGATSHVAILARSLNIAAVAGIEAAALEIADATPLILDAGKGQLHINPGDERIARTLSEQAALKAQHELDLAHAHEPAVSTDGKAIEVVANIGGVGDALESVQMGGEGVGLLRSEFLFLERLTAPTEEEQYAVYRDVLLALEGRPLIVRTLDVGGDKPLPYLPLPREENPFLGQRGIRIGLERPELFRVQARAILRAGAHGKIRIMFPMIATIQELRDARAMLEQERQKLGAEPVETGIMVEVPATAVMAEQFAQEVDFFSVGTNDLSQYTLAMDRGHPKLAAKIDGLNPAVLHLIQLAASGAHSRGKWLGVCGGMAADPQAVPVLLGLGVDELSVAVPALPSTKAVVRQWSLSACKSLARQALACCSGDEVRELVEDSKPGASS